MLNLKYYKCRIKQNKNGVTQVIKTYLVPNLSEHDALTNVLRANPKLRYNNGEFTWDVVEITYEEYLKLKEEKVEDFDLRSEYLKEIDEIPEELKEYLMNVERTHFLTDSEDKYLVEAVVKGEQARRKLYQCNSRLVVNIAKEYEGNGLDLMELIKLGNKGLRKAAKKAKNTIPFKEFASWWIRQTIINGLTYYNHRLTYANNNHTSDDNND